MPAFGWPGVTIGIITALPLEGAAMATVVEDLSPFHVDGDPNEYKTGTLPSSDGQRRHGVVLTTLPQDNTRNAAAVCTNLLRTFTGVRCVIMAGIAGGIPVPERPDRHVRLGDVVVAVDGIVDYGHVRAIDGAMILRRSVDGMSMDLRRATRELQMRSYERGADWWRAWSATMHEVAHPAFMRPSGTTDVLYVNGVAVAHPDPELSGHAEGAPKVHHGAIGCADVLLRDEERRDELSRQHGIMAVEMESAGIAAGAVHLGAHWFVVRGIADYCEDVGKTDQWHGYAAMVAAVYLRAVLAMCRPFRPDGRRVEVEPVPVHSTESRDAVSAGPAQPTAPGPPVWGNVPPRNPTFTGRKDVLVSLARRLHTGRRAVVLPQVLFGRGGVGKSQIAIEYVYRHRRDYDLIWWVPSEEPTQIVASLMELGRRLGPESDSRMSVPRVRAALSAGTPFANWLLVFDNAESVDIVREYFPGAGAGKILVTSRNAEWARRAQTIEVGRFTRAESVSLLQSRNPGLSRDEADLLADAIADLPLAVEHAEALLTTAGIDVGTYVGLLREKEAELAGSDPYSVATPMFDMAVAVTTEVALDRLAEEDPAAVQLLQVCSFFAPEPIERDLFIGARPGSIVEPLDEAFLDPDRIDRLIRSCRRYRLLRVDHRRQTIQLHRLVRAALRRQMSAEQCRTMEHGAHMILASRIPGAADDPSQWPRYRELAPHIVASNAVTCRDGWARHLILSLIAFYYYWGDYQACRDLAGVVVDTWRKTIGADNRQTLWAAKWLGFIDRQLGSFEEAAAVTADCLEWCARTAGPDDISTLDAMLMVAADLRVAGRFGEARALDVDVLERARRELGGDDPLTLKAANNLGVSMRAAAEFRAARDLDSDTYGRFVTMFGDDHPETLRILNSLLVDQRECGEYARAHRSHERLYLRHIRLFGLVHPLTTFTARLLAVTRRYAGDMQGARELSAHAIKILDEQFGLRQLDAIALALNFSIDVRETGDLPGAYMLAVQAVERYETALGTDHPYTHYARANVGSVLRKLDQVDHANQYDLAAWHALTASLGPDHVLTLTCAINLASDRAGLGDLDAARELGRANLARARRILGPDHPTTLACAINLAFDEAATQRSDDNDRLVAETLDTYRKILGDHHPNVAAVAKQERLTCDSDPMPF